jgi:anti-sigma regulatory factor (Ser/Thr protein kinase)
LETVDWCLTVSEPTEGVNQGHQGPHDEVAERHEEQQLPIRPAGAVGPAAQIVHRVLVDQLVELGQDAVHLLTDLVPIHLTSPGPAATRAARARRPAETFLGRRAQRAPGHVCRAGERLLAGPVLPGDARNDLLLAVNEAASNRIEHAYAPATVDGTVELTFWTEPRSVCVEIVDHGRWRTPCGQPTGRGRGIAMMQRLIPVVLIHYDNRGTRVLLSHPLPGLVTRIPAELAGDGTAAR